MYCPNCGNLISDDSHVCRYCGTTFSSTVSTHGDYVPPRAPSAPRRYKSRNGWAIAGFICSLFAPFFIFGFIASIIGLVRSFTDDFYYSNGRGFAIAGLIISGCCIFSLISAIVALF